MNQSEAHSFHTRVMIHFPLCENVRTLMEKGSPYILKIGLKLVLFVAYINTLLGKPISFFPLYERKTPNAVQASSTIYTHTI